MKLVPSIVALAAGVLVLAACSDDDERMAENAYRDSVPSTSTYPDTAPPAPSTTPTYPSPDPTTIPPTVNPESPTNPDGAFPPTVPPETTPPT
jgi:uncharacterized lipoprotein